MKKIIIILIGVLVLGVIISLIIRAPESEEKNGYEQINVYFQCADNEWIDVVYYNHEEKEPYAELVLSNGRKITVYRAISASGARYLSKDESIEFWTKGDVVVSIRENDEMIFENCVAVYDGDEAGKTEEIVELANPASVYCEEQGGVLEIRTMPDGGQQGFCIFEDGSECEEWEFFWGECN